MKFPELFGPAGQPVVSSAVYPVNGDDDGPKLMARLVGDRYSVAYGETLLATGIVPVDLTHPKETVVLTQAPFTESTKTVPHPKATPTPWAQKSGPPQVETPAAPTSPEYNYDSYLAGLKANRIESLDRIVAGPGPSVLDEAAELNSGEREATYGPPIGSFTSIAALWSAYLGADLTPNDVGNLMVLMKVSRNRRGYNRDTVVDIAGYARSLERCHDDA